MRRRAGDIDGGLRGLANWLTPVCVPTWQGPPPRPSATDLARMQPWVWRHRVPGLFWRCVSTHAADLPESVRSPVEHMAVRNAQHALANATETVAISERARAEGLPLIVLKGPALSQRAYGDATLRHSRDIDILTEPHSFAEVERLLLESGYRRVAPTFGREDKRWCVYQRLSHHGEYRRADTPLPVELHWRLHAVPSLFPAKVAALIERREWLDLYAGRVPVLSRVDQLLYLCTHGARHNWRRLKWVCDLPALAYGLRSDDIEILHEQTAELGLERLLAQGLRICDGLWPQSLPPWTEPVVASGGRTVRMLTDRGYAALGAHLDEEAVSQSFAENLSDIRAFLLFKRSWRYKLTRLRNLVFEPDFLERSPWAGRHLLLYVLIRPFRWLFRQAWPRRRRAY